MDHVKLVIEPLCRATEQVLAPARLRDTDTLFVWMTPDAKSFLVDLRCIQSDHGHLRTASWPGLSHNAVATLKRVPERKQVDKNDYHKMHQWKLAATDFTVLVLSHAWPKAQIQMRPPGIVNGSWEFPESEAAQVTWDYLLRRFHNQARRAEMVAAYKEQGVIPPMPSSWHENAELPLSDYQRVAAIAGIGHDSLALFADRGTGKTAIAVQMICHKARCKRAAGGGMFRALVVCTPGARYNWKKEFERFASISGKVTVLDGDAIKRLGLLKQAIITEDDLAFSACIVGYDTMTSMQDQLASIRWDAAVGDESHKFKSDSTQRCKAMLRLRECSDFTLPATGSPIGNNLFDLWSQLEFLGTGMSGFESFKGFRAFYGKWKNLEGVGHGVQKLVAVRNLPLLHERLARVSFSITKKEAGLNLPDKQYDYHEVEMTPYQAEMYKKVQEAVRVEIEDKISGDISSITAHNILTTLLRLSQVTSGHVTWDAMYDPDTGDLLQPKRVEEICSPNPKVEGVIELLTEDDRDPLGKTIIWCHWRKDIELVCRGLDAAHINHLQYHGGIPTKDRFAIEEAYNKDPNVQVIVCTPPTAGESLNLLGYDWDSAVPVLETNTDHEIFFSCNWSALDRGQAEDRGHRRGTRGAVRITDLIVRGTIDEEQRDRVRGKQEMAQLALDIKDILRKVLP